MQVNSRFQETLQAIFSLLIAYLFFVVGLNLSDTQTGLRGYLEVGYAFERELVFRSNQPGSFNLSDTVLVGGGLAF